MNWSKEAEKALSRVPFFADNALRPVQRALYGSVPKVTASLSVENWGDIPDWQQNYPGSMVLRRH